MPATEVIREVHKRCECGKLVFIIRDGVVLIKCECGKEIPVAAMRLAS